MSDRSNSPVQDHYDNIKVEEEDNTSVASNSRSNSRANSVSSKSASNPDDHAYQQLDEVNMQPEPKSPRSTSPISNRSISPERASPREVSPVRSESPERKSPQSLSPEPQSRRSISPGRQSPRSISPDRKSSRSVSPEPQSPEPTPDKIVKTVIPQQIQANGDSFDVHPAFLDAGQKPGLEIWKIEKFEPVRQDPRTYGQFYRGDCYLVLNTKTLPGRNKLHYDLHFWQGLDSSQDEVGSVAIRAVELDESVFDGAAVQYKEVQGHETKLFLSYFRNNIRYLAGGTESGFTVVDRDHKEKKLFQLKGRKNIRIAQVPCVCGSLNQGDTFVLSAGKDIYVWIGPLSTDKEKLSGIQFAKLIRDENGGKAHIHIVPDWASNKAFYKALGSHDKTIKAADKFDDEDIIRRLDQLTLLYKVVDDSHVREVGQKPFKRSLLKSDACYILDSGATGMYLWTGKKTPVSLRKSVWNNVSAFMDTRGYPFYLPVIRVIEGGETPLFKQYFESWDDDDDDDNTFQQNNIADQDYSGAKGVDIKGLHKRSHSMEEWLPDDGSGEVKVWRIENRELVPVPERSYGVFFGGDSYVILYKYGGDNSIIYFWQGTKSSVEEKGAAAIQAAALDNKMGGRAVQIRVVQNKEPLHFIKIFGGKLIYFTGGRVSGFRSLRDYEDYDPRTPNMFQIRGTEDAMRAVQVNARAASLNSNDAFIVDSQKRTFAWIGRYASKEEKTVARLMLKYMSPDKGDPSIIDEGHESGTFWSILGGEEKYYKGQRRRTRALYVPPRLLHCTMTPGKYTVEEIVSFNQEDLIESDVMLLDTFDEIFVWVGKSANDFEKRETYKTAYSYLKVDGSGRTPENTLVLVVKQGFEPLQFTGCFPDWDIDKWNKGRTFEEIVAEVGKENAGITLLETEVDKYTSFYEYEELKRRVPPEGVDPKYKEMYLSPSDFQKVFGMDKEYYKQLPEWKRINLKKKHSLF